MDRSLLPWLQYALWCGRKLLGMLDYLYDRQCSQPVFWLRLLHFENNIQLPKNIHLQKWLFEFVFLFLLAIVFAPKYLAAKVTTMPEFMGNRYGESTQTILAWYALIKILISWLSLGLFAGGFLVRQILGIPMWQSVTVLVLFAGLFTFAGGLKAIAKVNVFQMILLICVSLTLTILGIMKVGGVSEIYHRTPGEFWNLIHPASHLQDFY